MSSRSRRRQPSDRSRQRRPVRRTAAMAAGLLVAAVVAWGAWTYSSNPSMPSEAGSNAPSGEEAASPPPGSVQVMPDLDRLKGRWVRPDGGYIIEINGIEPDGRMDVRYYNPNPIHVSQATLSNAGGVAKVFIELRDAGYPGATYTLLYNPRQDMLMGDYYQPAVGQTFDVVFMRYKPAL